MNLKVSSIVIRTDAEGNGVLDTDQTKWTWSNDSFDVIISKGSSSYTLYKTAKAYMQLKVNNAFTIVEKSEVTIKSVTIYTTNETQFKNLVGALGDLTFTQNADNFSVTIEWNSAEQFTFMNKGTATAYISGVDIIYE
jgi:hypothetical protein